MKANGKKQEKLPEAALTFCTGENFYSYQFLGCHPLTEAVDAPFVFRVWAPHAKQVAVVGDFADWDEGIPMSLLGDTGIWEAVCPEAREGQYYKYCVTQADGTVKLKIDPFGFAFELRPDDATIVKTVKPKKWQDGLWYGRKKRLDVEKRPMSIYEVHAGSWRRDKDDNFLDFAELQKELIPYVKEMGYTHIEFMPLMEHPLDDSWGYQLTGYYALSARFGQAEGFMDFVEECHLQNIGVIMDWVPGHFCANDNALRYFDGTPQFEYVDPDRAINHGWGALNFDLGNPCVQSFLISNAFYWLELFHLDGLRVDAVSNMLYRDYDTGPWTPNEDGGVENYEGIYFIQKLNSLVQQYYPTALTIAEESSAWPKVTAPVKDSGLGFHYKWNMGWMNDVLRFYAMDPLFRKDNFNLITFSFMYMYSEKYILPLSHDEVVHGKKSLMHKMFGNREQQFAHLRNLFAYMISHPGKQLSFMGNEWGQFIEWRVNSALEWIDLEDELNAKMEAYTKDLNAFYQQERAFWELDHDGNGIEFIDADNREQSVLSFIRKGKAKKDFVIVVLNFTPVERPDFEIGVPYAGTYEEVWNSELVKYGGTWEAHNPVRTAEEKPFKDFAHTLKTTLPASGVLFIKPKKISFKQKKQTAKQEVKATKKDAKSDDK